MEELKMPVRVLQSGKVYRQMFDAEVQLRKSIDASRVHTKVPVKASGDESVYFPELLHDKPNSVSSKRGTIPKFAAGTISDDRRKTWADGMPNDSKTENPVMHRQLTAEAAAKLQERESDAEAREVRGLPNVVHVVKKDSDIVQRIAEKRQERHKKALDEMHIDLSVVSNRIEPRITSIGENLQKQLKEDDEEIVSIFAEIESDEELINFALAKLDDIWMQLDSHSGLRRQWIQNAIEWLNQVEDERLDAISGVLKKSTSKLEKIASMPKGDLHRLIEHEAMMINQSVLANRRAYAKLYTNLMEADIEREITQHMTWTERVKDWKKLNAEIAVKQFNEFMNREEILHPPGINEVLEMHLKKQARLAEDRCKLLEQLKELQPPKSTKSSVYDWNASLCKTNEELDKLHVELIRCLHQKYEATCQMCLTEIEKYKQNLLESRVCDEDDMRRIVNDHLLPAVGERLRSFEKKLERMDQLFDELATRTERQLKRVFKFAQGAAHLWDVHEIRLAKCERQLENELEQNRLKHDAENQEREARLDIVLDRLRQESTEEALTACLNQCLDMLGQIKDNYQEFHQQQLNKSASYPEVVNGELQKYDGTVCTFFNVNRNQPSVTPDDQSKVQRKVKKVVSPIRKTPEKWKGLRRKEGSEMESELEKVVRDILTTDKGTSFYVLTVANREDFEADEENESQQHDEGRGRKSTFLTEFQGTGERPAMPDYIKTVFLETSYIRDLKKTVRLNFLNHLELWKERAMKTAEYSALGKQEELASELDLRMHLHAPRATRVEVDVRNVRAAELVLHRERVARHCNGIYAALDTLRQDFTDVTKQHDQEATQFRAKVEQMEKVFAVTNKSSKLITLTEAMNSDLDTYVSEIKCSLRQFRQKLDTTLARLRTSNAQCVRSFKFFSEGGNFSPEETVPLRKRLEKISLKVDSSEGSIMKDLEGMESRRIDRATEVVRKFEEGFKHHLVDVTFMESMKRWLTNAQVRIKTEVAHSNGMAAEVASHLSNLKRRVDACERPNIDKETVTPELLRSYVNDVIACLHKRAVYLNCKRETPVSVPESAGVTVQAPATDNRVSSTSEPQATPVPSASPAPSAGRKSRGKSESPMTPRQSIAKQSGLLPKRPASPATLRPHKTISSRQGLDTQGSHSKLGRQPTDDVAIGLIKNILRTQKGRSFSDYDDTRSAVTATTKAPPSTSNSQGGTAARQTRGGQRGRISLASMGQEPPSSLTDVDDDKKALSSSGIPGVYRRRETKFDAKYMIFGFQAPEAENFLGKVQSVLFETLDGMLSTAEVYYKQKNTRALTRPQHIQDNFDQCAEKVIEKLAYYDRQARDFHNSSLQDFRKLLKELEEELCAVPRVVLDDLFQREMDLLTGGQHQLEENFAAMEKTWNEEKKSHQHALRPVMGHPEQEYELVQLAESERDRQNLHFQGIESHAREREAHIKQCASQFVERLSQTASELLRQYDDLLTIDDVIVGRVPPRKVSTSVLLRRRADGVDMNDVADPSFGVKPIVERGPRQWPGIDVTMLDLPRDDGTGSEAFLKPGDSVHCTCTTLPHTTVASQRDLIFDKYCEAHGNTAERIRTSEQSSVQAESRWKDNWQESIENVRNLYR